MARNMSCAGSNTEYVKLLRGAATSILMDESFTIPTEEANLCLQQARAFVRSLGRDGEGFHAKFAHWLVNLLSKVIDECKSADSINREKLWRKFHSTRTGQGFTTSWKKYLIQVEIANATPLFYQHISQELFETLISQKCHIKEDSGMSTEHVQHMTLEEENALRYVAGYVIRTAKDSLTIPNDQEVLDILNSMVEETPATSTSSEAWVKLVNRGGLVQITEDAYQLFCAIEYSVRSQLQTSNICNMDSTFRSRLTNSVLANGEVQFRWLCIGETDEEAGETCLEMIVRKWITIRGFSFANSVMEQYKQQNKKSTAKSKSLRTKLFV